MTSTQTTKSTSEGPVTALPTFKDRVRMILETRIQKEKELERANERFFETLGGLAGSAAASSGMDFAKALKNEKLTFDLDF